MIDRLDRVLVRVNQAILIALLAAMSVIVFANVMLRFLTDVSIVWAEEAARYMMIWLTFLGMG
ncbi:MAG: TRAP transporter small permease, partial [Rhodospirillales bacterium]